MKKTATPLRPPEELVEIGFSRSGVVMMNDAHDGQRRCIRTREVGRRILPTAHAAGARNLAMEALWDRSFVRGANETRLLPEPPEGLGYLAQPDMRSFMQDALDLGWTLIAYEADMSAVPKDELMSHETWAWRQAEQARNLAAALPDAPMLVWPGLGHLTKKSELPGPKAMAWHFQELTRIEPFSIDQTVTIQDERRGSNEWNLRFRSELEKVGGTAGFLVEEAPSGWSHRRADAYLLSLDNELV